MPTPGGVEVLDLVADVQCFGAGSDVSIEQVERLAQLSDHPTKMVRAILARIRRRPPKSVLERLLPVVVDV
jgi:hypothetical protein